MLSPHVLHFAEGDEVMSKGTTNKLAIQRLCKKSLSVNYTSFHVIVCQMRLTIVYSVPADIAKISAVLKSSLIEMSH